MNIKNSIKRLLRNYQTRQQLRNFPIHLCRDIGKTPENIAAELNKTQLFSMVSQAIRQLLKGG